jgi:hypothetical protein
MTTNTKSVGFIPLVLAALCTLPLAAQQPDAPQPQSPQPQTQQPDTQQAPTQQPETQQAPPAQQSGQANAAPAPAAPAAIQLSPVTAELTGKLDSKTAKAGDSVVLKTTEKATMADGTVIPKGTKIMGHVTEAQPYVANSDNGRITLQFEQAQLKGGQNVPIKSAIQTVTPAGSDTASSDTGGGMPMGGGAAGGAVPSGGSSAGAGSTSGSSAARTQQAPSAGSPTGMESGAQSSSPAPGTTVARNGNVVVKTTSVPGVLVAASVNGQPFSNASGALLSARQDVRLDDGTKVVLAMATSPGGNIPR